MSVQEQIAILEAYQRGEVIQEQYRGPSDKIWKEIYDENKNFEFSFTSYFYRIKPEYVFGEGDLVVCKSNNDTKALHIRTWCKEVEAPYKSSGNGTYDKGYYKGVEPYGGQDLTDLLKG